MKQPENPEVGLKMGQPSRGTQSKLPGYLLRNVVSCPGSPAYSTGKSSLPVLYQIPLFGPRPRSRQGSARERSTTRETIINKRPSTEKYVRALIFDSRRPSYRPRCHYDAMKYALVLVIFTLKESVRGP